jgi:hypothetical protein
MPGRATSKVTALMPDRTINLAFFYKPPSNSDAAALTRFGSIVLTAGDEKFRDQILAKGYDATITQYYRAEAIQDPGNCKAEPWKNQIAYKTGDFCNISKNRPDWFLLDTKGRRIRIQGGDYYRMDPGNAEWRKFFVNRLIEINQQRGWSGVFLDNLEAGLNQIERDGVRAAKYKNTAAYRLAVKGFVDYLYTHYAKKYNRPIMANIIARSPGDEKIWYLYMGSLHGAMQERWAVDWDHRDYLSAGDWNHDMALAEKTQKDGKFIILVAPGGKSDTNRQKFAFASYLLISNGKAAFRYSNASIYREIWMYDNYKLQLGSPLGPRYKTGSSWRRDFQKGYVIVDPVKHTATISTSPAPAPTAKTYNDNDSAFVYSKGWSNVRNEAAYKDQFRKTEVVGSSVKFTFTGKKFTILYKTGPLFGQMDIYVDGKLVHTLNQNTEKEKFLRKWSYPGTLKNGQHTLKLVFKKGPRDGRISIDGISIP